MNPFRFSSEYFAPETGLVYYNYRYYSPDLGRWLSRNPIAKQGGWNLYGMVGNSNGDRLGLIFETAWDAANVAMGIYQELTPGMVIGTRQLLALGEPRWMLWLCLPLASQEGLGQHDV